MNDSEEESNCSNALKFVHRRLEDLNQFGFQSESKYFEENSFEEEQIITSTLNNQQFDTF